MMAHLRVAGSVTMYCTLNVRGSKNPATSGEWGPLDSESLNVFMRRTSCNDGLLPFGNNYIAASHDSSN